MSFLRGIFGKSESPDFDFSAFKMDVHSHLIPGIDDGSPNMESTIEMLRKFESLGYKKIITTPHVKTGVYDNSSETIRNGVDLVKAEIEKENLKIELDAAAEYFFDFSFLERIEKNDILSFSNGHVLLEYSFHQKPMGEAEMYFQLQMKQYQPILAHFERYPYYHGSVAAAEELRNKGVKIQLNLLSLFGHYGPQVQKQAEKLIRERQIDIVATDCHRIEHLQLLEANRKHKNLHALSQLDLYNFEI